MLLLPSLLEVVSLVTAEPSKRTDSEIHNIPVLTEQNSQSDMAPVNTLHKKVLWGQCRWDKSRGGGLWAPFSKERKGSACSEGNVNCKVTSLLHFPRILGFAHHSRKRRKKSILHAVADNDQRQCSEV